jgi:hypothetical protein
MSVYADFIWQICLFLFCWIWFWRYDVLVETCIYLSGNMLSSIIFAVSSLTYFLRIFCQNFAWCCVVCVNSFISGLEGGRRWLTNHHGGIVGTLFLNKPSHNIVLLFCEALLKSLLGLKENEDFISLYFPLLVGIISYCGVSSFCFGSLLWSIQKGARSLRR